MTRSKKPNAGHVTVKDPANGQRAGNAGVPGTQFYFGPMAHSNANPFLYGAGNIMLVPTLNSPDREITKERNQAVANARKVDRNHQFIRSGITRRAVNLVGADLKLKVKLNWRALGLDDVEGPKFAEYWARTIEPQFEMWADDPRLLCDAGRRSTFGANMLLAARNAFGADGECLIIPRYSTKRRNRYKGKFATFIEVIDTDRLSTPCGNPMKQDGPTLKAGKELDEWGAATGYWIEDTHPTDSQGVRKWTLVPREDKWGRPMAIHWFFQTRAGAQRNMPMILASLRSSKMLEDFDDATLQTAIINAILSVYVESEMSSGEVLAKLTAAPKAGSDPLAAIWDKRFDFYKEQNLTANGARIPVLPPGDKITMASANRAADSTKDFRSAFMRGFAAELNLNYEAFSGDYSESTFSSIRQGLIDIWRIVTAERHLFTRHVAAQVYMALLEEFVIDGIVEIPDGYPDFWENMAAYAGCEFRGPGMGWVDPNKDIVAAEKRVGNGMSNYVAESAAQGEDFHQNIDSLAEAHAYARGKGVWLPTMLAEQLALQKIQGQDGSQSDNPDDNPDDPQDDPADDKPSRKEKKK